MSLVYRPNIAEISNAITKRKPYREPGYFSEKDKTYGLFKSGKLESMINNIFVFDKQDSTDLAIISELSTFGFKIIESMDKILVSASISDLIHLFKNCPDKNKFIWTIYEDLLAYYQPEYFRQLIDFGIVNPNRFSPSYADTVVNDMQDITLESISLFHCDLYTYSLSHHFDEVKPSTDNEEYVMSRDKDNYISNTFGEAYDKLNISFFHLSKILNISYFVYRANMDEITDFINKNNISKYSLFRSIEIMGHNRNDVVLITTSLYDFMSTFQTYKNNPDIYNNLSDGIKSIVDDMEALFDIINNAMINTVSVDKQLTKEETEIVNKKITKTTEKRLENTVESIDKFINEINNPTALPEDSNMTPIEEYGEEKPKEFTIHSDGGRNLFRDVKSPQTEKIIEKEKPELAKKKEDSLFRRIIKAIKNE